jgi:hypothetical protein
MDYEALQNAWRSSGANPDAAARAYIVGEARATVSRRRAHLRRMLAFAAVMLVIPLALMTVDIVTGQSDFIDLRREWGLIPFALIPFAALILIIRRGDHRDAPVGSLLESFHALRNDNAAARTRIFIIGGAMVVFAPLLIVLLNQLNAVGKMAADEMLSAGLVLGGALAASALWMAVRYFTQLQPERRHLDALIAQYQS